MFNDFVRWLKGAVPQSTGVYWGAAGACLVQQVGEHYVCAYSPRAFELDSSALLSIALQQLQVHLGIQQKHLTLSVAIDAEGVFVKSLAIPAGLSDQQLEQLAIVEAVANLPVPPEEVCVDFIRMDASANREKDQVDLAFCRRERIDDILGAAEQIPIAIGVIDRDTQALHDVVAAFLRAKEAKAQEIYPFGILLPEIKPRVLICQSALLLETYAVRMPGIGSDEEVAAFAQQINHCWTRCRMTYNQAEAALDHIVCVGQSFPEAESWLPQLSLATGASVCRLPIQEVCPYVMAGDVIPPDEALLIALGMVGRQ